ncbi:MAG: sporulation transcription factor Spo0A [Clostridia bacterium]|nr:sporulation transcription factor Spo0A [Clostridia bacterium]
MKKIIVIEDNVTLLEELKAYLEQDSYFDKVYTAKEGKEALSIIRDNSPDIILTDIAIPNGDGIWLLESLQKEFLLRNDMTVVFMMDIKIPAIEKLVVDMGADYFVLKPFDIPSTITQIKAVSDSEKQQNEKSANELRSAGKIANISTSKENPVLEQMVTNIFHELGMPAHIKGYEYLRYAILRVLENRKLLHSVTKELYPMTAKEFDSKPSRVERAIRHAIEVAWTRGDADNIAKVFGCTVLSSRGKPTNSEFLAMIADNILLRLSA